MLLLVEKIFWCLFTNYNYEYKKIERINSTGSFIEYSSDDD